jgi:surface protein
VGKVTDMYGMFQDTWNGDRFSNLDLSRWNVGEVTDMGSMFSRCARLQLGHQRVGRLEGHPHELNVL